MSNNYKTVRCVTISVDCCPNNPEDIRIGGPEWLGFDFFVPVDYKEEVKDFIMYALQSNDIPLEKMYEGDCFLLREGDEWIEEKIMRTIRSQADIIKEEYRKIQEDKGIVKKRGEKK